jgi:multidrug efflux pump subunit AcrA (membrane-fusion protein)
VGARSGDWAEIRSGLTPGQKVIVSGAGFLKDGDAVTVVSQ